MTVINQVLGVPLGYVMYFCFHLVRNYGWAIVLFSFLSKILFFPLSVSSQKNSIRLLKMQPAVNELRQRYGDDKERFNEELYNLYKREKYNPLSGSIPLLIQLPLILGMINVMYNPLQHLLHLSPELIATLADTTRSLLGVTSLGFGEQLQIIDAVQNPANLQAFQALGGGIGPILDQIQQVQLSFLGINLGMVPQLSQPSILLLVPLLSGLSTLVLCLVQNRLNPAAQQQGPLGQWLMTLFLVAFSVYFTLVVPCGVGVYWIAGNIFSLGVAFLVNLLYNPKRLVGTVALPVKPKLTAAEKKQKKQEEAALAAREKADAQRFQAAQKQLVFFAISSGQYKYFSTIIDYLLQHSDIVVHYLTTDPADAIFDRAGGRLVPYYASQQKTISLMLKMEADMVAMTVPDLQKFHIKKSIVKPDVEYVYIFHSMTSIHLVLREGAFDHYNTMFCVGPHQAREIRRTEEVYKLPAKRLVKAGSSIADVLLEHAATLKEVRRDRPQILIAPSWQADCIPDSCLDPMLEQLLHGRYRVIVRLHPEYIKRFPQKVRDILDRYEGKHGDDLVFELNFASSDSIYQSDLVITDWSTIALEFSYCTKRPSLFINTPMKIMNPNYQRLGIEPVDITMRRIVGMDIDTDKLDGLDALVDELLGSQYRYRGQIEQFMQEHLYHPGRSGEAGGKYIMGRLGAAPSQNQ